jgi:hypothetical protein
MVIWKPSPFFARDLGVPHVSQLGNAVANDCGAGALVSVVRRYNPASALTVEQAYREGVPQAEWGRGMTLAEVQYVLAAHGVKTIQRHNGNINSAALSGLIACLLEHKPVIMLILYAPLVDAGLTQFKNFTGNHYVTAIGSDLATVTILDPYADDEAHGTYQVPADVLMTAWGGCKPSWWSIVPQVGIGVGTPPEPGGYRMVASVTNGLRIRAEANGKSKDIGILLRAENPVVYVAGQPSGGYIKLRDRAGWVWYALLEPIRE